MHELAKLLILLGLVLLALGVFLFFASRIPFLGRLPGDIFIQKRNLTFYFPITTSLVISLILSFLFWLWFRR